MTNHAKVIASIWSGMAERRATLVVGIGLFFLSVITYFPQLGVATLTDWDECIYAEASRQMFLTKDYLNVVVNGQPFAEKPPFFFWLQAMSYHVWGVNEFAARFPSACAGVLMILVCYLFGSSLVSERFGVLWALIYLTAGLPGMLARAGVIDHTFNLWITVATLCLFCYDKFEGHGKRETHGLKPAKTFLPSSPLAYLLLASLFMGIGVLTKGPLGGFLPLAAYAGMKIAARRFAFKVSHFLLCALVSLTVASSWYLANLYFYGFEFIVNFAEFQSKLFSQPLEGHRGPFFYHFISLSLGLMPWSWLLALGPYRLGGFSPGSRDLLRMCLCWIAVVLCIFSLVSTKLPHYSASAYIPLSLICALMLEQRFASRREVPGWMVVCILSSLFCVATLVTFLVPKAPQMIPSEMTAGLDDLTISGVSYLLWGVVGLILLSAMKAFLRYREFHRVLVALVLANMIWTFSLWRHHLPFFQGITVRPLLELVERAKIDKNDLVFYRFVSFAALFYGVSPIEMLHTYKFEGDPGILRQNPSKEYAVITTKKQRESLLKDYPNLKFIEQKGRYLLYKRPQM